MFSRIIRIALPLLILVAGIGGMTALVKSKPEREALGVEERSWPVAAEAIEPGTVTPQLLLFALVDSPRVTHLSAAVTADVDAVDVLEGQRVGVDDRLLALDDREIRLIVAQRDAELAGFEADLEHETLRHRNNLVALKHEEELLALARREVARARDLADRNVGSQASLDQVRREEERQMLAVEQRRLAIREHDARRKQIEARLARAQAQRSQALLDLDRTRVHPPFFGRITEVFVSPGDRVRPGDRLVAMFDSGMLELRAQIPLRHLPVVRAALEGGESLSARALVDGQEVRAELHRLTARVDRGSGGADGLFRVTRGNAWLQLGRTVELVMDLPAIDNAVTAPREALYGTDRVFVLDGERMRSVEVERLGETRTAGRGDARLILRSPDLKPDGRLIVTHQPNAIDGLKVRVAETPPG
ncbi:MAG: hypothetical protein OXC65_04960 [Thiotrichales bacterium]|nr:hypothetical protein [Thiotrichales bacterium]